MSTTKDRQRLWVDQNFFNGWLEEKIDEAGLCVGDFSLQECFISPRKRADLRRESFTDEAKTPRIRVSVEKRGNFETASRRVKKISLSSSSFLWSGRGIRGQRRRKSSNSMPPSQTHHRRHLEKVIWRWDSEIERVPRNRTLREKKRLKRNGS